MVTIPTLTETNIQNAINMGAKILIIASWLCFITKRIFDFFML